MGDQAAPKTRAAGPTVAVVGRANVGKSTLVNRLLGHRAAIEHPEPGVTRDRQAYAVEWAGMTFGVVDTGGWEPRAAGLAAKVVAQAERAARLADLILFVVDTTTGATADDLAVARSLRRAEVPVVVVANKVDDARAETEIHALERLGLGPALPVSALHGRGSGDLMDVVVSHLRDVTPIEQGTEETRVAIVGRPNVGKSSLFNRLVGDERSIVDAEPGTTRDAVDTVVETGGGLVRFVDTAGMRRHVKRAEGPEYYGLVRSLQALDAAEVAIIVVDAVDGPTEQDQKIARRVSDAGRAAVVLLNKWDLVDDDRRTVLEQEVREQLRFVAWAPIVRTSALTGRGIDKILPAVERARAAWTRRVPTSQLNGWLREAADRVPLGSRGTKPARIRYATQARSEPPEIILFATARLSDQALRALERRLREQFDFEGTPVRMLVRQRTRSRALE